jgi:hypothetical protein
MATSAATPAHTPASEFESPSSSTSHTSETDESETDEAEEICSDLEIGRAVLAFKQQQQPKCEHEDEYGFLTRELSHFKSRDVLIKDLEGNILAGLSYETRASISSVYHWMALIFQPADGWSLIRIFDDYVLNRFDNNLISRGEYRIVDSGEHGSLGSLFS